MGQEIEPEGVAEAKPEGLRQDAPVLSPRREKGIRGVIDHGISAEKKATTRCWHLPIADVVACLESILGARVVALMGGVGSTRSVRAWTNGEYPPAREDDLRFALQVADILLQREGEDTVRAWFAGMNHLLDDENPALLISAGPDTETKKRILRAARHFVSV